MTYPILPGGSPIPAAPRESLAPGVLLSRPCVCGTCVTASRLDPGPGVAEHNRTTAHKVWAKREGLDGGQGDE